MLYSFTHQLGLTEHESTSSHLGRKIPDVYPQLVISLDAVAGNAATLVARARERGVEIAGVTKAVDGEPLVGQALLSAGCTNLADSRLPALQRLAAAGLGPLTLIRPPQPTEIAACAEIADRVLLSDPATAGALGELVEGRPLEVLLTVDLGDRREGLLPGDVGGVAGDVDMTPGCALAGIAVNFACLSGQLPTIELFHQAEDLLTEVAGLCDDPLLSLGGTCCLQHLDSYTPRFRTEVRSGGGPLYGYDFVTMAPLAGLERHDPVLTGVVLECYRKPPAPPGPRGCDAFGHVPEATLPDDDAWYALLNLGRRDCEPGGLRPLEPGARLAGATSDVTVLVVEERLSPGDTVDFAVDYDALVRAVTSPFVEKVFVKGAS
jgi:predicted amino acid racemase